MKKSFIGLLFVLAVVASMPLLWILAGAAEEFWNTWTYRYRLAVHVSASGQTYSGSSVIQVQVTQRSPLFPQSRGVRQRVSGEAVVIDLVDRATLFVLLRDVERPISRGAGWGAPAHEIVSHAFPPVGNEREPGGLAIAMRRYERGGERTELTADQLPLLAYFDDLTDPKSIKVLAPSDFATAFGSGMVFLGATIETVPVGIFPFNQSGWSGPLWLTGVPVTRHIKQKLPWLEDDPGTQLVGPANAYDHSPRARIEVGDFLRR